MRFADTQEWHGDLSLELLGLTILVSFSLPSFLSLPAGDINLSTCAEDERRETQAGFNIQTPLGFLTGTLDYVSLETSAPSPLKWPKETTIHI